MVAANSCRGSDTPFRLVLAACDEGQSGTGGELAGRRTDEDLARGRSGGNPGRDVHGDPAGRSFDPLELARVDSGSDHQPKLTKPIKDGECTTNRARRAREGRQEAVADSVDLFPSVENQLGASDPIVRCQEFAARAIAHLFKVRVEPTMSVTRIVVTCR